MHTFERGTKVSIINCTMGGKFIVEGEAVILNKVKGVDEQYRVRFLRNGKPSLGEEYERFVDPQAQQDPVHFVQVMNSIRRTA